MFDQENQNINTEGFASPFAEGEQPAGQAHPFDALPQQAAAESDVSFQADSTPQDAVPVSMYIQPPQEANPQPPQSVPPQDLSNIPPQDRPYTQPNYTQPVYGQSPYGQPQPGYTAAPSADGKPGGGAAPNPASQAAASTANPFQAAAQASQPKQKKERKIFAGQGAGGGGAAAIRLPGKIWAIFIVIVVIACLACGLVGGMLGAQIAGNNAASGGTNASVTITPSGDVTTTEAVAKKVLASVVGITTTGTVQTNDFLFGSQNQQVTGVGTGMIIDKNGYILTNSHVVLDGSVQSVKVLLNTGDEVDGKVIWNDKSLDLAIVKITAKGLVPVEIGDSSKVQIGQYIAAIGNPLGLEFNGSITQGVVSGLDRTIQVQDDSGNVVQMDGLIQVDASINPGNSGGPLLNSQGQVVGINTAKASAEGMGFAIPINNAIPVIDKVIKTGSFERVYMGISAADVSTIKQNYPNVEIKAASGAVITDVSSGSPADQAGLKVKDVITAVDSTKISNSADLVRALLAYNAGDVIKVEYNRDGAAATADLKLISQSDMEKIQQDQNPFQNPPQSSQDQNGSGQNNQNGNGQSIIPGQGGGYGGNGGYGSNGGTGGNGGAGGGFNPFG
ncbi:MAG: trypsin-like peptidase domain-containing protein [Clostridiales bacterium]|nr:trypsin-like peptidase domain-containing protein [Clostridiales bacterium]